MNAKKNKAKSLARRERAMAGSPESAERITRDSRPHDPLARAGRLTAGKPKYDMGGVPVRFKYRKTLHRRDLK